MPKIKPNNSIGSYSTPKACGNTEGAYAMRDEVDARHLIFDII